MQLQRSIGNSAVQRALGPQPMAGPPAKKPSLADNRVAQREVMDWLSGTKKVRLRVGDWNLYRAAEGKRFGWSTDKGGAPGVSAPLALGVAPLPLPVGPVELELDGSASAYAGGNALIDVSVKDVVLDATVEQLIRAGVAVGSLPRFAALGGGSCPGLCRGRSAICSVAGCLAYHMLWRGWMGIEPTRDGSAPPLNGFEDRGRHQPPNIPTGLWP